MSGKNASCPTSNYFLRCYFLVYWSSVGGCRNFSLRSSGPPKVLTSGWLRFRFWYLFYCRNYPLGRAKTKSFLGPRVTRNRYSFWFALHRI